VIDDIHAARDAALGKIAAATALDDIVRLDQDVLGKRGTLTVLRSSLGAVDGAAERKDAGRALNEAIDAVSAAFESRPWVLSWNLQYCISAMAADCVDTDAIQANGMGFLRFATIMLPQ